MSAVNFEAVIGLEVHAQLLTQTKLFCGCSTKFGGSPNSQTCPVCLGLPGALPVLNQKAVEYAIKAGIAVGGKIAEDSIFARKNYFYPDLPKGYQISQYEQPLITGGALMLRLKDTEPLRVGITRIHLEEDAGKLTHDSLGQANDQSLVDLNRAGVPLIEIVSEPDMRSPEQASEYLKCWRQLLRYLRICDGNLEEGSMRCDANVSVRPVGETKLSTKVEIKNINSFRFVQQAIKFEIARQIECRQNNQPIVQETRLWDSQRNVTRSMRSKEEAQDYRYFPDPDLLPVAAAKSWVSEITAQLPELPEKKLMRFMQDYQLSLYDALFLTEEQSTADYFENCLKHLPANKPNLIKDIANWLMGDFTKMLKDQGQNFSNTSIAPQKLTELVGLIDSGKISGKIAKTVFVEMSTSGQSPAAIVSKLGVSQISDSSEIKKVIAAILSKHPQEVKEYRGGKEKLFGFFVGQVMRETKGQANPELVNSLLKSHLSS